MLILIVLLTAINNWAIPVVIYASKFGLFKKRVEGFVGCNFWGVVMDVFIAGVINVAVWNYLASFAITLSSADIVKALMFGVLAAAGTHIIMAATAWKEWIMPEPWRWNAGGYWHMVSETIQMAYVFLVLVTLADRPELLALPTTQLTLLVLVVLGILFLLALSAKDKDIVLGDLELSAQPW